MPIGKVVIWQNPDGSVQIQSFIEKAKLPWQTEDEFIEQEIQKNLAQPAFKNLPYQICDAAEIDLSNKRKLRMKDGKLHVDDSVVTNEKKNDKKLESIKAELKKIGLSDDAIELVTEGEVQ